MIGVKALGGVMRLEVADLAVDDQWRVMEDTICLLNRVQYKSPPQLNQLEVYLCKGLTKFINHTLAAYRPGLFQS